VWDKLATNPPASFLKTLAAQALTQIFAQTIRPLQSARILRDMKHKPRPIVSKVEVEALVAAMIYGLACLVGLLLRLGKPRKTRRLEKLLRHAERQVECTIFMQALQELGLTSRAAPTLASAGSARTRASSSNAAVFACATHRPSRAACA
jgi:hypothetical protein